MAKAIKPFFAYEAENDEKIAPYNGSKTALETNSVRFLQDYMLPAVSQYIKDGHIDNIEIPAKMLPIPGRDVVKFSIPSAIDNGTGREEDHKHITNRRAFKQIVHNPRVKDVKISGEAGHQSNFSGSTVIKVEFDR